MPSVLDHPTTSPLVRATCAIIRLVVVLPLVPVTANTGMAGVMVPGRSPRGAAATSAAAALTASSTSGVGRASSAWATASPSARARSRLRHGKATMTTSGSGVGRTRTARRRVPASPAMARTRRSTARRANRCRKPDPGAPGLVVRRPMRRAKLSTASSPASVIVETSRVSFTAARGK